MKWIKLLVSGGLLAVLAWRTDWKQVGAAFAHLRLDLWLVGLVLYLFTQVLSAFRWQLLARPLGFERPLGHYLGFYYIAMFFNLMLPTSIGGDVVRVWYLIDRPSQRLNAFLSVLADRASGLLILMLMACIALLSCPVALPPWIHVSVWGAAGSAVAGVAVLWFSARAPSIDGPRHRDETRKRSLGERVAHVRSTIGQLQALYLSRPGLLAGTTLLSIGVQAANIGIVWLVSVALGLDVPGLYYAVAVPMITLLTLLPSINGIGLREWGLAVFLKPLGVAAGSALTLSFLWFLVFTFASALGGVVYMFARFPRPSEHVAHGPVGNRSDQGRAGQLGAAA